MRAGVAPTSGSARCASHGRRGGTSRASQRRRTGPAAASCSKRALQRARRQSQGWVATRDRYDDNDYYDDYDDGDFFIERPRHYRPFYPFYRSQVCWGGKNTSLCFSD